MFGAGVLPNGQPTQYLRERVQTAVNLYKAGRVKKLLMTGDNGATYYNEPRAMRALAMQLGVPEQNIVLDYAGFNTYDSCYRAHAIFKVHNAVLVSQGYHLPRALMTCNALGINSIGIAAAHTSRDYTASYIAREFLSTDKALVQIIAKPLPTVLGNVEPISVSQ
ncbi:MAG TPA: ElyC/SanA/YdcF family protein [Candidatus Saccharimonadales bacterium]|nr:ElyC/SanA/YdcF family protein [Candidatus Saccharimonadales bacterium]